MANKRANPLSGYFKSPPTAEKSKEAAKAEMEAEAGILGSTGEEQKPPEQTKDGKEQKAPAANGPAKPGEEQKPPEQAKDGKEQKAPAANGPAKPGEEQKPPEQAKDGKEQKAPAADGPAKPGEEQKPPEPTKDGKEQKAPTDGPTKPGEEQKPPEPTKDGKEQKASADGPTKPGREQKPPEPTEDGKEQKASADGPAKPGEEQKPPEPTKDGKEQKVSADGPAKPGEEQKPPEPEKDPKLRFVKLSDIKPLSGTYVKDTPRSDYSDLIASIKEHGLEQPIILRQGEKGDYQLVHGFHRCEALKQAGMLEIRADVYAMKLSEASDYRRNRDKNPPIPGTLILPFPTQQPEKAVDGEKGEKPPLAAEAPSAPGTGEPEANRTAEGPKGSTVTHIFDDRLDAPGDSEMHSLPIPKEGEVYSLALHPAYFRDFLDHPFTVNRETQDYQELFESIKTYGIREPIKCRPGRDGGVEIISGHRRHDIGMQLNYPIPTIIEQIGDDDAQIQCVDGNLHRKDIPLSELARAAEMKMDALKRKQGRRSKADILSGKEPIKRSDELVGEDLGMSRASVQRLVRVNQLEEPLKKMVDNKKLSLDTAEQISHLKPEEQKQLADAIEKEGGKVPSKSEAVKLKEDSKAGNLTPEKIEKAVAPTKREMTVELKVSFTDAELRPYFPAKTTTPGEAKKAMFEGLALRQKALERQKAQAAEKQSAGQDGRPKKPPSPTAGKQKPEKDGKPKKPPAPTR